MYRAIDQFGQVIEVLVAEKRDLAATGRFVTRALGRAPRPAEVTTDRAQAYPRVLDELLPAACHVPEKYADDPGVSRDLRRRYGEQYRVVRADSALAFDCIAGRGVLGDEGICTEIQRLAAIAGQAPVAGFYTYGEIARTRGCAVSTIRRWSSCR